MPYCRHCGREIMYTRTANEKWMPYDVTGQPHFCAKDGKKANRILWSVAPGMKCFMTDSVVLYGAGILEIWNKTPGETVVCDRYESDEKQGIWLFFLGDELRCRLRGGRYVLPMDEFWMTELRDHPEAGTDISQ